MKTLILENWVTLFLKRRAFALLILSFLILRLGTLLTCVECVTYDPIGELRQGTIAKELIEGLKAPIWNYQAVEYQGGSFFAGILAVPLLLLLGPRLFALKLVSLLFSLATLILSFYFFKRFFDRKTALFVSAFLLLPPPIFTILSLGAEGTHPQSIFLTIAIIFCFYQFLYQEKSKTIFLILFGLLGGFGSWFALITSITPFTCLVSWFLLDRRSFWSWKILVFLGCFLVGASPFIPYIVTHGEAMSHFLDYIFLKPGDNSFSIGMLKLIPLRLFKLIFEGLPFIFRFRPFLKISGTLLSGLYGLVAILLVVPFFWQEGRRLLPIVRNSLRYGKLKLHQLNDSKLIFFFLYPFFFILAYVFGNPGQFPVSFLVVHHVHNLRLFPPLYYFAFSLFALVLRAQKRPTLFLGLLLSLGLIGQGSLLFKEPFGRALNYQGYSYQILGEALENFSYPFPEKFDQFQEVANRLGESEKRHLYWGLAKVMDEHMDLKMLQDPEIILNVIHRVPLPYRSYFIESWGRWLCYRMGKNFEYQIATLGFEHQITTLGQSIPEEERPYFYYGLATRTPLGVPPLFTSGECLRSIRPQDLPYPGLFYFYLGRSLYYSFKQGEWNKAALKTLDSLGTEEKLRVWRGMGYGAAEFWIEHFTLKDLDPVWRRLPAEARAELFWGMGWRIREKTAEDRLRALDRVHRLPAEYQALALKGFLAFENWQALSSEPRRGMEGWL